MRYFIFMLNKYMKKGLECQVNFDQRILTATYRSTIGMGRIRDSLILMLGLDDALSRQL
jgi:hypothetical protein